MPNDVWAVGGNSDSVALHWDGVVWSSVTVPNIGTLSDLAVTGPNDVWAAGGNVLIHWDGTNWTTYIRPAGGRDHGHRRLLLRRYMGSGPNGRTPLGWKRLDFISDPYLPGAAQRTLADVVDLPNGEAWAVGEWINYGQDGQEGGAFTRHSFVVRWDGTQWNNIDTGQATSAGLTGVDARSSSEVWAVGNTGLVFGYNYMQTDSKHWNGSAWTDFSMPPYLVLTGVALAGPPE